MTPEGRAGRRIHLVAGWQLLVGVLPGGPWLGMVGTGCSCDKTQGITLVPQAIEFTLSPLGAQLGVQPIGSRSCSPALGSIFSGVIALGHLGGRLRSRVSGAGRSRRAVLSTSRERGRCWARICCFSHAKAAAAAAEAHGAGAVSAFVISRS